MTRLGKGFNFFFVPVAFRLPPGPSLPIFGLHPAPISRLATPDSGCHFHYVLNCYIKPQRIAQVLRPLFQTKWDMHQRRRYSF